MILLKEFPGVRFREDILRGVRLFAIVFAAILLCLAAYRVLRAPSDVQGAAATEALQPPPEPSPDAAPDSQAAAETHPLVVPEPPPVATPPVVSRVAHPRTPVKDPGVPPPPPPVVRARRAQSLSGREFEASQVVVMPAPPVEDSSNSSPPLPKQPVGYKSLMEANPNSLPTEAAAPAPAVDSSEKPAKGNRFFRAVGKIFHPSGKKDTSPSMLQPKQ